MPLSIRGRLIGLVLLLSAFAAQVTLGSSQEPAVMPARVAAMQNHEVDAARSGRPAYLPRSWGRLAAVQNLGGGNFLLVLEADSGDLRFVRLVQRGEYLYLDTRDQGGVVTILERR